MAAVVTLLITMRWPRRQPTLYDPEVSDGKILVGVEPPYRVPLEALQQALVAGGASYPISSVFRLQGEAFAHIFPNGPGIIAYAGPGLEIDKGRLWTTLSVTFGSDFGKLGSCSRIIFGVTL